MAGIASNILLLDFSKNRNRNRNLRNRGKINIDKIHILQSKNVSL